MHPKISVLIPCFNAVAWIEEAIQSALRQNYPNVEVVVVDDGSTDGSSEVIRSFGAAIVSVAQPNSGVCSALNHATRLSTGSLLQVLGADDVLHPDRFSILAGAFQAHPAAEMVASSYRSIGADESRAYSALAFPQASPMLVADPLTINYLPTMALARRDFIQQVGSWNEALSRWVDFEYHARIAAAITRPIPFVDLPLYGYRQHSGPRISSQNKAQTNLEAALRSLEKAQAAIGHRHDAVARRWLHDQTFHLARGYAARNDRKFYDLIASARANSDKAAFKYKAMAVEFVARIAGIKTASRLMEAVLSNTAAKSKPS